CSWPLSESDVVWAWVPAQGTMKAASHRARCVRGARFIGFTGVFGVLGAPARQEPKARRGHDRPPQTGVQQECRTDGAPVAQPAGSGLEGYDCQKRGNGLRDKMDPS